MIAVIRRTPPVRKPRRNDEAHLVAAVLAYLGSRNDVTAWRNNTGGGRMAGGRVVRFSTPGAADVLGVLQGGRFLAVECKSSTGRLSPEQRAWGSVVAARGGLYVLACTLDDVIAALPSV